MSGAGVKPCLNGTLDLLLFLPLHTLVLLLVLTLPPLPLLLRLLLIAGVRHAGCPGWLPLHIND